MIRWIKKGVLCLAGREVGPGGEFPESALSADRLAEFLERGWAERIGAKSEPIDRPVEKPLVVNVVAPRRAEPAPAPKPEPKPEPEKPSKTEELNERQEKKPRRRGRPRKAR